MADSLAARRAVREHLETNFDEYLTRVSAYLRQTYAELQLSTEVSEEIAATVIVRVSHANAEPDDIEEALLESADEVVRARRPRLAQAKLLDEAGNSLRSEIPRALPSLRLVQSLGRVQAPGPNGETNATASTSRLVLANPPVDLGASLFEHEGGTEADSSDTIADDTAAPNLRAAFDDTPPADSVRDSGLERSSAPAANAARFWADTDTDAPWDDNDELTPSPQHAAPTQARPSPPSNVDRRFDGDVFDDVFGNDASSVPPHGAPGPSESGRRHTTSTPEGVSHEQSTSPEAGLGSEVPSSVPPTRESMRPAPAAIAERPDVEVAASEPQPRTRRKTPRARKPGAKTARAKTATAKATSRTRPSKSKSKRTTPRARAAAPREPLPAAPASSVGFVADDLAVLSMLGFPSNPRRAALLCVTAVSEELGIDGHVDLSPYVTEVLAALEQLKTLLDRTSPMAPDAHLQWQRVARQATLRAFLVARPTVG